MTTGLNGPAVISSVVEYLRQEDLVLLLDNRGIPSVGTKQELVNRLQTALAKEICEWEWEQPEGFHADIVGAGSSILTHNNSIIVFGGMDDERMEHMQMWKWDLSGDEGFEPVPYRGQSPPKLSSGHYAAVYGDELWVFPGPRNHNMRRVYCCDLLRFRWAERSVLGEPPSDVHARRNLDAFVDGQRMLVFGGPQMETLHLFDFETRTWSCQRCTGGLSSWTFGHACKIGRTLFAFGCAGRDELPIEVWQLDLVSYKWRRVACTGTIPPYRIHASAAVVNDKWILHGGRRPGKFNVTNNTFCFDFATSRWSTVMFEGPGPVAREWHRAVGLQDCMVVVGGRIDIPDYEPIPLSCDTMCTTVELLWYRPPPSRRPPTGKAVLLKSVRDLFSAHHLSDVTLVVKGRRIPAHRHVLATHSRVFERMWGSLMRETKTSEVHIPDFDYETINLLLRYMYGCLQDMPKNHSRVLELFKASDKYDVAGLVKECVQIFRSITEASNVAALLQVAHERDSTELKGVCLEVATSCLPNVLGQPSFLALTQSQPDLALNFIAEVCAQLGVPRLPVSSPPSPRAPANPDEPPPSTVTSLVRPIDADCSPRRVTY